jgi:CubicO group peptidase (beta-lactamase class C family)
VAYAVLRRCVCSGDSLRETDVIIEAARLWRETRGNMTDRRGQLRLIVVTAVAAAVSVAAGCTAAPNPAPIPMPSPTPTATSTIEVRPPTGVDYEALETELKRRLAAGPETVKELRSILISVDGTTELAFYQDSAATDHRHVWSVTKSVLSILVGIAIDEGRLRLDQPLAELLPEHASVMTDDQKATTLRQLLTMTGGMAGDGGGLNPGAEDPIGLLLTYSSTGPRDVFAYSDSGAHLVAAVLQEAVDRSVLDYAREELFDPLGIDTEPAWEGVNRNLKDGFDDAGFAWQTDSSGTHIGGYGLKLTPPDLVKLGELYLDEGVWHGRRIVSADWVRASTAPQLTEEQAGSEGQYGYLWRVEDDPEMPLYTAVGAWCQLVLVVPSRRVVVVSTVDDSSGYAENLVCDDVVPIVEEVVFGRLFS